VRLALDITRRNLPHWQHGSSTYFITYRCVGSVSLDDSARTIVLDNWRYWHAKRYLLHAAVVMPDHVHVLITPKMSSRRVGEVRAGVKLINALDEALARRHQLAPDQVRVHEADALVDTGAARTVIPVSVAQLLGLATRGQRIAVYADGHRETVDVSGPFVAEIDGIDTLEEAMILGDEVILGQTVLKKLDLVVDCVGQRLIPNPAHPDGPVFRI
jgi:predicted aspartyl protease